jgi:hypothetical protein
MRIVDTAAAELATGVRAGTLRQWLRRRRLTAHGHDYYGRALVDLDEIAALKARAK